MTTPKPPTHEVFEGDFVLVAFDRSGALRYRLALLRTWYENTGPRPLDWLEFIEELKLTYPVEELLDGAEDI